MDPQKKLQEALKQISVVRHTRQTVYTFSATRMPYYLAGTVMDAVNRVEIRSGRVTAERPRILTPSQLGQDFFEGFGDLEREQAEALLRTCGRSLEYRYRNETDNIRVVPGPIRAVIERLKKDAGPQESSRAAIIRCEDSGLWGLGLVKCILDVTVRSFLGNVTELEERGFFPGEG